MAGRRQRGWLLGPALALAAAVPGAAMAACQDLESLSANFDRIYPSGGPTERFAGAAGERIMSRLSAQRAEAQSIVFLYSGDGPVTGARGRYLYLVLDPGDCILGQDWIDGPTYDRAVTAE